MKLEMVKRVMHERKNVLRPMTEEAQAPAGSTIAFDTRYEVSTQVPWSSEAPRLPAMCGKATFAMEVSSTSIKAANATVAAMIQGLTRGFHCR